jgi:hypothetical protein
MSKKKDLVIQEEIDKCLRYFSKHNNNNNNNKSAQEQLLRLLQEVQITLDEPIVEDSINGTRIRFTYITTISRKGGGIDEAVIKFQYMKEIPVDYSKVPLELRDNITAASTVNDTISHNNNNVIEEENTIIESYDELEKGIPTLCEVLGLLKKIYFMPEDFSNRFVVDRIHKLRDMFSKDEILTFPSIDLSDNAGLIPI